MWLFTIKNNNKFCMKLIKYIGWKKVSEKNYRSKTLKKYYSNTISHIYPDASSEIIIANDKSTDNTLKILQDAQDKYDNLSYIDIDSTPIDWAPKKWALHNLIQQSQGDIIIQTDADCVMGSKWIETIINEFNTGNIGFVCGASPIISKNVMLNEFYLLDSIAQDAFAASCIMMNFPLTCTGRNIAFTKKAFNEVNGYENISTIISGDDDLLLHKISNNTKYQTKFCLELDGIVESEGPNSITHFINQRSRWASKSMLYYALHSSSIELKLILPFIFLVNLFCIVSIIKFIQFPSFYLLLPWIIKSISDIFIIKQFITDGSIIK